ncbi:Gfo/Idh/MocA family oxidoreductase [Gillisia sp. M10.2A]|uniref:Gfo/Idh/MocA family oxidoreductase n=1 Tax=Gillisia lutea TaxID=2909668 RepID=A0ABS9EF06_9FLAO|nr:Gfo/Idh/MocA family oxidoreductase [Gillisia lutea]MCF4101455.1 Gfo/Idh/MocA family oxidoreductase [Gillisia lutea]
MKNKTFKWGIIGLGKIAGKFASDLQKIPNAELYAVASRSDEKAEEFAKQYNAIKSYGSYDDLVNDAEVEVIYIATPHVFHFEHTMLCLKHKKAVLCEKPFAINSDQVKKMIATSISENVFLMEALWTHFLPHYKYVLELVRTKEFGEITHLKADFGFAAPVDLDKRIYNKKLGGGSLLDVGIYPVFAALSLLGKPDKIRANATLGNTGIDKDCSMIFEYANNNKAHLYSSIHEDTPTQAVITFEKAKVTVNSRFHEPSSVTVEENGDQEIKTFETNCIGYKYEALHVQEMLSQNRIESDIMTFNKSLKLIGLLDAIREEIGLEY